MISKILDKNVFNWPNLVVVMIPLLFLVSCTIETNNNETLPDSSILDTTTGPITPTSTQDVIAGTPTPISLHELESATIPLGDLIYADENGLAKVDLDTGEITRISETIKTDLITGIREAVLSPDRRWIAYLQRTTNESTLNLIDFEGNSLKAIINLSGMNDWTPYLFWSADGSYLFITFEPPHTPVVLGQPRQDPVSTRRYYLYSFESGEIESWDRDCDRIGFSSRTNRVAMWCPAVGEDKTGYAVVEWGGEIWFTTEPPDPILKVRAPEFALPTWSWSSDGQQVVYSNQDQASPQMLILATTHSGELTTRMLGEYSLSYIGLNWSTDQRYIAFKGECPSISPCLQVLDLQALEIVWTSESLDEANRALHSHMWHPAENLVLQPSSFGNAYYLYIVDPVSQMVIKQIELQDGSRLGIGWVP